MKADDLASLIDHTLLRPDAKENDIESLCGEAVRYGFHSVCINPFWVRRASDALYGSPVKVCTVCGFPLGANAASTKLREAYEAVLRGAHEIDMAMNIGEAKEGRWDAVSREISDLVSITGGTKSEVVRKIIIEASLLTEDEIMAASHAVMSSGAEFVKTSTGFGKYGARAKDILIINQAVSGRIGIKASGGIKTLENLLEMTASGATRIGTSSAVSIMRGL